MNGCVFLETEKCIKNCKPKVINEEVVNIDCTGCKYNSCDYCINNFNCDDYECIAKFAERKGYEL